MFRIIAVLLPLPPLGGFNKTKVVRCKLYFFFLCLSEKIDVKRGRK